MQNFDYGDKIIGKNEKWFNLYVQLPLILTILSAIGVFTLGIVLGVIYKSVGLVFLCWLAGSVSVGFSYVLIKALISPTILKTCYLEKISFSIMKIEKIKSTEKKVVKVEEKETRAKAWVCPKCKELNNALSKNCINCFEPRP